MALGRGLGDILLEVEEAYEKDLSDIESFEVKQEGARIASISIESISPNPYQPRKHFDQDALEELSASIVEHGLLQPIVVIEKEKGFLLVAGERRLRAHQLASLSEIKAIIADIDMDEVRLRELALIENIQRENLNAIELADSYAELIEVHKITHEELSRIVHKSRSQITNTMRLLSLSERVKKEIVSGKISQGHAKVLVGLDVERQERILHSIIGQKLSVRETEKMVKKYKETPSLVEIKEEKLLKKYEENLHQLLPFPFKIKAKSLEISLSNEKDIHNFLNFLKKAENKVDF